MRLPLPGAGTRRACSMPFCLHASAALTGSPLHGWTLLAARINRDRNCRRWARSDALNGCIEQPLTARPRLDCNGRTVYIVDANRHRVTGSRSRRAAPRHAGGRPQTAVGRLALSVGGCLRVRCIAALAGVLQRSLLGGFRARHVARLAHVSGVSSESFPARVGAAGSAVAPAAVAPNSPRPESAARARSGAPARATAGPPSPCTDHRPETDRGS